MRCVGFDAHRNAWRWHSHLLQKYYPNPRVKSRTQHPRAWYVPPVPTFTSENEISSWSTSGHNALYQRPIGLRTITRTDIVHIYAMIRCVYVLRWPDSHNGLYQHLPFGNRNFLSSVWEQGLFDWFMRGSHKSPVALHCESSSIYSRCNVGAHSCRNARMGNSQSEFCTQRSLKVGSRPIALLSAVFRRASAVPICSRA